jgi:DNA-binding CsgD family transcriptional regulator
MRRDSSGRPWLVARFQQAFLLSAREADVVELASLGHGCKEIAFQLGCRPPTVDIYWTRIYRKTGCRSHLEVMATLLKMSIAGSGSPESESQQHRGHHTAGRRR